MYKLSNSGVSRLYTLSGGKTRKIVIFCEGCHSNMKMDVNYKQYGTITLEK